MNAINLNNNASYNFVAPLIEADSDQKVEVVFPTSEKQVLAGDVTIDALVERSTTIIDLGELTAAGTLDLTIGSDVPVGAILTVKAQSDATARDLTFGTGMIGPVMAGVISKTKTALFIFDGVNFVAMAAAVQID